MQPLQPVFTAHLFPGLHSRLMELLHELPPEDWQKPTVCRGWSVQDVASHMLDTQIRILSRGRDAHQPDTGARPIHGYTDLVQFINELNAQWIQATRRISPRLLTELLSVVGPQLASHYASIDPHGPALFAVAWAGESESPNWFDMGRNYTEYWHHQQQIRDAVGKPGIGGREWLNPVLALFVRALPRTYQDMPGKQGCEIQINISGEAGDVWTLVKHSKEWQLYEGSARNPEAQISISCDAAWRLFTKGLRDEQALAEINIDGDQALGSRFLSTIAVMG